MNARSRRPRPPLDEASLAELALRYVGRFATTRHKLAHYLTRKARERGWDGAGDPPIEAMVERCVRSGFVDDAAFAVATARTLTGRGYGAARVRQSLRVAGVDEEDSGAARRLAADAATDAALRFARRRAIGPFGAGPLDRAARERAIAAMVRAGHSFGLARAVVDLEPGAPVDADDLTELAGRNTI